MIFDCHLSALKWIKYDNAILGQKSKKTLKSGKTELEYCVDECMERKIKAVFENGNFVDKLQFWVTGPPINIAWWVASCTFDCV